MDKLNSRRSNGSQSSAADRISFICNLFLVLLAVTLAVYSLQGQDILKNLYGHTSFYIVFGMFALWTVQLKIYLSSLHFNFKEFIYSYWLGISFSLIMSLVIFLSVPVYLKILNDEAHLLAVSQSMFYHQDAHLIFMSKFYHDTFHIVQNLIPNRPLAFPFATYLLHTFLGYQYQNVFILNFILTFFFLAGAYICTRQFTDTYSGLSAVVLVAAYPLFSIYATSGGYDLFSTIFFYLSMILLYQYLRSPSASCFAFLWATLLILANIRYESCIFFLIIILSALLVNRRNELKHYSYVYALTPLLFLPYIWQRFLSAGTYENPQGVPLFATSHFFEHLALMIKNFLNLDMSLPYAGILNLIALVAGLWLVAQIFLKKVTLKSCSLAFWIIYALCLTTAMIIVLSHHLGLYDHPAQARLFFYFGVFCSLSPIVLKIVYTDLVSGKKMLIAAILIFILYHPIAAKNEFIDQLRISRIHKQEQRFLNQLNDPNILIVSAYPDQYSSQNFGSISFMYANKYVNELKKEMSTHLYSKVLIFQWINPQNRRPYQKFKLNESFKIQPIKNISVTETIVLRIAQLKL